MPDNYTNCTPAAVDQFPLDLFSDYARQHGAIAIHLLVSVYTFIGIAIVCDKYFVASLEKICERFHLSEDVAGATFMAAGSSGPELATTLIGVFIAQDDIGLSAVVGSAVYNVLFIVGLCGIAASATIMLNWWPVVRDVFFYTVSILLMVWFISDGWIYWYEALGLLLVYALYIVEMVFNDRLERLAKRLVKILRREPHLSEGMSLKSLADASDDEEALVGGSEAADESQQPLLNTPPGYMAVPTEASSSDSGCELTQSPPVTFASTNASLSSTPPSRIAARAGAAEPKWSVWEALDRPAAGAALYEYAWWIVTLPLRAAFALTIPDCTGAVEQHCCRLLFMGTFSLSVIWIGVLSYVMVWMLTIAGYTFHIPDTVMAMTVLAFGVSVPDALASYFACKQGQADMAISNAVGSNIFDILICLGLPWLLRTAFYSAGGPVRVFSRGIEYAALTLLANVIVYLLLLGACRWRLGRGLGWTFMVLYFSFLALACLYELNVFGHLHDDACPSKLYEH